ncbi:MAG: hypothetical protein AAB401_23550, partial [Acidobacteriota bacterium]
ATNWLLMEESSFYYYAFAAQTAFYLSAVAGWVAERLKVKIGIVAIPYYFMLVNVASIAGVIRFISGDTQVVWEPMREGRGNAKSADTMSRQLVGKET